MALPSSVDGLRARVRHRVRTVATRLRTRWRRTRWWLVWIALLAGGSWWLFGRPPAFVEVEARVSFLGFSLTEPTADLVAAGVTRADWSGVRWDAAAPPGAGVDPDTCGLVLRSEAAVPVALGVGAGDRVRVGWIGYGAEGPRRFQTVQVSLRGADGKAPSLEVVVEARDDLYVGARNLSLPPRWAEAAASSARVPANLERLRLAASGPEARIELDLPVPQRAGRQVWAFGVLPQGLTELPVPDGSTAHVVGEKLVFVAPERSKPAASPLLRADLWIEDLELWEWEREEVSSRLLGATISFPNGDRVPLEVAAGSLLLLRSEGRMLLRSLSAADGSLELKLTGTVSELGVGSNLEFVRQGLPTRLGSAYERREVGWLAQIAVMFLATLLAPIVVRMVEEEGEAGA